MSADITIKYLYHRGGGIAPSGTPGHGSSDLDIDYVRLGYATDCSVTVHVINNKAVIL